MIDFVTGSRGFIGSHLMKRLRPNGIPVPHRDVETFVFHDCRTFFHLSAYGNLFGQTDPREMIAANVLSPLIPIGSLLHGVFKCQSFVFASSSSVTLPVQTPYARCKRATEEILLASGLPVAIARLYSVTGVGEQAQHLIPTLIRSCMEGTQMNFVPNATHDFIDVDDVVSGLLSLADQKATGIFEIGKGLIVTNQMVREYVEHACGRPANVNIVKSIRDYDTTDWVCRDSKMRSLGWKPKKTLKQSIEEMVEAYAQ